MEGSLADQAPSHVSPRDLYMCEKWGSFENPLPHRIAKIQPQDHGYNALASRFGYLGQFKRQHIYSGAGENGIALMQSHILMGVCAAPLVQLT